MSEENRMKHILVSGVAILLIGCTTLDQKAEHYKQATRMAADPECIQVLYGRENDQRWFGEMRCSGKGCDKVPACQKGGDAN